MGALRPRYGGNSSSAVIPGRALIDTVTRVGVRASSMRTVESRAGYNPVTPDSTMREESATAGQRACGRVVVVHRCVDDRKTEPSLPLFIDQTRSVEHME